VASIYDLVTTDWLKSTFLAGIDLTLDDGSAYPDVLYEQSIRGAVAYLEHELGIVIDKRSFTNERHDALNINRDSWWAFRLDQRPVLSFQKWTLQFGSFDPVEMPVRWLQLLAPESGQVHLIPSQDQLGSFLYSAGVPLIMGGFIQPYRYIPGYFGFDYTAGFDSQSGSATIASGQTEVAVTLDPKIESPYYAAALTGATALGKLTIAEEASTGFKLKAAVAAAGDQAVTWSVTTIPRDIIHLVGLRAAMLPIDIAGDLISGAGVANYSIGADGVHQSLGTTSSATNCLTPETTVVLADGSTPTIKSLVGLASFDVASVDAEGNPVVGRGHHARVTTTDDVLAVRLSTGDEVRCNSTHPFRLSSGDYVAAGDLVAGQVLTPCGLVTDEPVITVLEVVPTGERRELYDITVDDYHCFGIGQGVIVHNSGYGARRQAYERELKARLPALRAKYRQLGFGVI
jgi:hypothetical protein